MKDLVAYFKSLPSQTKVLFSFGILFAFLVALPLFIRSLTNNTFDIRNRAQEASSSATPTICNLTVNPPITCPEGYECISTSGLFGANGQCLATGEPTATPSANPIAEYLFKLKIKFEGVASDSANGTKVTLRFVKESNTNQLGYITSPFEVNHLGFNIYGTTIAVPTDRLAAGDDYIVFVKGEKHLAKKFCHNTGQTSSCSGFNITVEDTANEQLLDFSGVNLEPGDLYPQDGIANSVDFNKIKALLSKTCSSLTDEERLVADLDYNGCINIRDAFLMRQTLETKYDEN